MHVDERYYIGAKERTCHDQREQHKPSFLIYFNGNHNKTMTYKTGYDQVQYQNGYVPGTEVGFAIWRNYSDSTISNAVRFKTIGTANCANSSCTTKQQTPLTSILEVANTNVTSIGNWKVLATIAKDPLDTSTVVQGKTHAKFSNVRIDGVNYTPGNTIEDYATVTTGSYYATISVSK
ncbi:hypothetical protein BK138_21200 [Paenibacillus rhizosphaerae]|uniref:Uncharacterized protein n=1 Tax=Paenibacillus rhizosphaerae TaxID=297318 RepID=A0A1R1EL82_9BACL|nr:hypothetical protein BK138_21200 [Paenibacillus rhizosphaerae]